MSHHLDHSIASDLSYQVLKRQRRESQITHASSDERSGLTHLSRPIPILRRWDAGEGEIVLDPIVRSISERDETPIAISYRTRKR